MNTTDLRYVLDERSSDSAEQVMHHLRLQGVAAKVRRRRRRRAAAWTTCVVVAIASVAAAVVPGPRPNRPGPAPAVRMIEGFPEYANGARVVAASSAALPERRLEVTIVPTTVELVLFSRCAAGKDTLEEKVTVNGRALSDGTCGGAYRPAGLDLALGQPATFVMTITGAQRFDGENTVAAPMPATGLFALAVGERVPFESYPLPPRPAALGPFDIFPAGCTEERCPGAVIIRSDPADPAKPVRRTVTWKTISRIDMISQTPGLLHLRVAGVEIATGEWWDYERGGSGVFGDENGGWKTEFGIDPKPGDQVTVEIVPEHLTGAWQVVLQPAT